MGIIDGLVYRKTSLFAFLWEYIDLFGLLGKYDIIDKQKFWQVRCRFIMAVPASSCFSDRLIRELCTSVLPAGQSSSVSRLWIYTRRTQR